MTLQGDASKTETAIARHAWLHDATGDEALAPATTHKISIFGLGYVGAVSLACLARDGHEMTGVDIDPAKLEMLRRGQAPIVETGIQELTRSGMLGLSFEAGTDDLRESPLVIMAERFIGKGLQLSIFDPQENVAQLVRDADVLVVASKTPEALAALQAHTRQDQLLLDVVGLPDREAHDAQYRGVCW
jgi:UDP-glucose 6-dehydrogenase